MSTPSASMNQDDDGPEEGEIEDDEDDIIVLGGSPQRSSPTSTSVDIFSSPNSYERDIRRHELHRARTARIRRASGGSKSPYSKGSSIRGSDSHRNKTKPRTGLTQGKENRHIHRNKSPVGCQRHRKGSPKTLSDFKDISPFRRDSSCSSIESEERFPAERSSHHRSAYRRAPRVPRSKRKSSSSPDPVFIPTKRRSHHSAKCPLIKVLHSVAKETRLIAMETSESNPETSSLKQKLLNMGVMPMSVEAESSSNSLSVDKAVSEVTAIQGSDTLGVDNELNSCNATKTIEVCRVFENESTQTDIECKEVTFVKPEPEIVTLTDSEEGCNNSGMKTLSKFVPSFTSCDKLDISTNYPHAKPSISAEPAACNTAVPSSSGDDDDDIGRLRLLALQSKKHEHMPPDDADVLELRLEALKTAFMKKFKIRKKIKIKISNVSNEDPLSPLDEIPLPISPASPDEVIAPVDMELAETDDEADSAHSMHDCYSPSDPTVSPIHEPSLQDLLPPPPPPDLPIDVDHWDDNNINSYQTDISFQGMDVIHDTLLPPPLPPYFRELLAGPCDVSDFLPNNNLTSSVPLENEEKCFRYCMPTCEDVPVHLEHYNADVDCNENAVGKEEENYSTIIKPCNVSSNLLEVPIISDDALIHAEQTFEAVRDPKDGDETRTNFDASENCNQTLPTVSPVTVESVPGSNPTCKEDSKETSETQPIVERRCSLEEEEHLLRQRLIRNMANRRNLAPPSSLSDRQTAIVGTSQNLTSNTRTNNNTCLNLDSAASANLLKADKVTQMAVHTELPTARLKLPKVQTPTLSDDVRLLIDLGEDSDSSGHYSEAESLGLKCAKNRENWLLHLKELEVNLPKMSSPGRKAKTNPPAKLPPRNNHVKVKQAVNETASKKPFAENLADLENSVERFLKGVRSSHDAVSKSQRGSSSVAMSNTPVAVRHLPASQQEEYRRLKQQIAKLEKQRQMSLKQSKLGHQTVTVGTQMASSAYRKPDKQVSQSAHQAMNKVPKTLLDPLKTKKDLKAQIGVGPKDISKQSCKIAGPKTLLSSGVVKLQKDVSIDGNTTALLNVSNISVSKKLSLNLNTNNAQLKTLMPSTAQDNRASDKKVLRNPQGLVSLEGNLVIERSHVLNELSALSKLLAQVDKSLEAQSHTATEVASLIDKLCLAAGRWKAQNRTVTGLVARVAQQQKELSQRHRRCVVIAKSCAELGNQLHGKNYRVPIGKADAMKIQLRQVHEKTQDLAKRRTAEQSRKATLEKRAEHCLIKLFMNSKSNINDKGGSEHALKLLPSNAPKKDEVSPPHPLQTSDANVSKTVGSNQKGISVTSVSLNSSTKAVSSSRQPQKVDISAVNPALISRALGYRLAQNRVRSAKALLNLSHEKRFLKKKKKGSGNKLKSNRKVEDQDAKRNLSDMDISSDCEETEKNSKLDCKEIEENTEVVDMSVSPSPDTSLSPMCVENGNHKTAVRQILSAVNSSKLNYTPKNCNQVENSGKLNVEQCAGEEQSKSQNQATVASNNVLKDYISPLAGINFSSMNSMKSAQEGDLFAILCPYDLNGKCQDSECPFKHQN